MLRQRCYLIAAVVLLLLSATVFAGCAPTTPRSQPTEVGEFYTDKNGYFSFLPPAGWTRKDFPKDPRSKVEFNGPDRVLIRIIAATTRGVNRDNVVEVTRKQYAEGLPKIRDKFPKATINVHEGRFGEFRAAIAYQSIPGLLEQELTVFVEGNTWFNIAYCAPSKKKLEQYREVAQSSLDTLVVGSKAYLPADREVMKEEAIARYLTLAELSTKMGDFKNAKLILQEALKEYPEDARLQKAMELVKKKKVIEQEMGFRSGCFGDVASSFRSDGGLGLFLKQVHK